MRDLHFLFVHGTFGRAKDWRVVEQLLRNKTNYTTSAITLPGHADRPLERKVLVLEQMRDALAREITQPLILVGYSLGGRMALHTLCHMGDSLPIRGLVLEGAHPGLRDADARHRRAALDRARAERIRVQGLEAFLDAWYRLPLFGGDALAPEVFAALVHERADHADPDAIAHILAALSPGKIPALWEALATLQVPLCFVHGARDTKYAAVAQAVQAHQPRTRIASIAGAHHNAHQDAPEAFVDALITFAQTL